MSIQETPILFRRHRVACELSLDKMNFQLSSVRGLLFKL